MVNKDDKLMKKKQSMLSQNQNNNYKCSLCTDNKVDLEAIYFVAGPNMETDRDTSVKTQ